MKAYVCTEENCVATVPQFTSLELPTPEPNASELLVKVHSVALNPIDYKLRRRLWQPGEAPRLLGFDVAGEVVAVGPEARGFAVGDAVYYAGAFNRPGAYADYHLVDACLVAPKPTNLSFAESAAMPLTLITAWEALFERLDIPEWPVQQTGKTLLIVGGAGGVGSIMIQLAKQVGLTVIATASRPESMAWCNSLGADFVVPHGDALIKSIRSTGLHFVDYVVNCSDTTQYWAALADLIRPMGKICLLVDARETHDINLYKRKSVGIEWEFMGARSIWPELDMSRHGEILKNVTVWFETGKLKSTLRKRLSPPSAETFAIGHKCLEAGSTIGKLVVEL